MKVNGMGYEINWTTTAGDSVLDHPYYQKFSEMAFGAIDANEVKAALGAVLASNPSAPIVAYLSWVLRVKALLA